VSLVDVSGVTFTYPNADDPDPALVEVSASVDGGAVLGVTGPADAGKTTFCRLVAGFGDFFDADVEGSVSVAGGDPTVGVDGSVGYVFEDPYDGLSGAATTVLEEVAFGLEQRGVPRVELRDRATAALDRVGVAGLADRDPNTLSGGQLQRVAVASVLALDPQVVVFDEATAQLDPDGTTAVFDAAADLREEGRAVVVVSQDTDRLAPLADDLLVLDDGRVVADGSPRSVFSDLDGNDTSSRPPTTVRIGRRLRDRGVVPADRPLPLTVDATVAELKRHAAVAGRPDGGDPDGGPTPRPPREEDENTDGDARLRFENVDHVYDGDGTTGVRALDDVDLSLDAGCVAVVGANGAGKTTLARHANGLLTPTTGRVVVAGTDTRDRSTAELAADVGLVFQDPADQLFRPTVDAEVRFGPENLGLAVEDRVQTALERLDLEDVRERETYDLGRAVRKRVAIASVLAMDTDAVVLDEPTGGQDAPGVDAVARAVRSLVADGRLVVCITHDVEFAATHADRVVALADGRVVADGPPRSVFCTASVTRRTGLAAPVPTRVARRVGVDGVLTVEDLVDAVAPA
jgi:energy-coupling factor transport system ATP-binding protein